MSSDRVVIGENPFSGNTVAVRQYTRPFFVHWGVTTQVYSSTAIAAVVGNIAASPFYVVQTLTQVGSKEGRKSVLKIVDDLFQKQGISAFFKGSLVGALRFGATASLNYLIYIGLKKLVKDETGLITSTNQQIINALSVILSSILTYPLEVIRTRLILDWEGKKYPDGTLDCWNKTVSTEGYGGLFSGSLVSAIGNYVMLEVMERVWAPIKLGFTIVTPNMVEAIIQSVLAQLIYYPIDTVLKMVQAPQAYRTLHPDVQFDGVFEAAGATVSKHGFLSLWRGLPIAALGVVPQVAFMSLAFAGSERIFQETTRTTRVTPVVVKTTRTGERL